MARDQLKTSAGAMVDRGSDRSKGIPLGSSTCSGCGSEVGGRFVVVQQQNHCKP